MKKLKVKSRRRIIDEPPPFYDPERDGVTFSTLSGWRNCREQSRLSLTGITERQTGFALVFGTFIHEVLRHVYTGVTQGRIRKAPGPQQTHEVFESVRKQWVEENPLADPSTLQHVELTMLVGEAVMPLYFTHWREDFTRKWKKLEHEFKYPLVVDHPSAGQFHTFIRGKMDAVFESKGRLRLFETKTKSRLDEGNLVDVLPFELQVMIYMCAIKHIFGQTPSGVLYNVIRRPGLRLKKNETTKQFAERIIDDIRSRPDWYFIRMDMDVESGELNKAEVQIEEVIAEFCAWWSGRVAHYRNCGHCENKYGTCWALPICSRKDYSRVFKRETVFRELSELV